MKTAKQKGLPRHHIHITRMTPKRDEEILAGGSLYWVIRGEIAAREKIIAIEPFRDRDGIGRCRRGMEWRSEEHTSELQSRPHLVCRLLLEKKKKKQKIADKLIEEHNQLE